jgi:hypothetical protein
MDEQKEIERGIVYSADALAFGATEDEVAALLAKHHDLDDGQAYLCLVAGRILLQASLAEDS